jgi:hypothetical protein
VINGVGGFVKLFIVPGGDEEVNESVAIIDALFYKQCAEGLHFCLFFFFNKPYIARNLMNEYLPLY